MKTLIFLTSCDGCGYTSSSIYITDKCDTVELLDEIEMCRWKFRKDFEEESWYLSRGSERTIQVEGVVNGKGIQDVNTFRKEYLEETNEKIKQEKEEYLSVKQRYEELKDKFE